MLQYFEVFDYAALYLLLR